MVAREFNDGFITKKEELHLDNNFKNRAESAYQEIKEILTKYNLTLDSDEGEGIYFYDSNIREHISIQAGLGHDEPWGK